MIPYTHSGFFCRLQIPLVDVVNDHRRKACCTFAKVVTFEATPKLWDMEDWRKWCKERTQQMISKAFPYGVDVMACCYLSTDSRASFSSWCCIIVASSPSLMILYSFSSRLFSTVSFKKLSSLWFNNAARIASLSVAGWNPLLIYGLDIRMRHWPCRWIDDEQCKCKCWFVF